jgi:hypothetical protein
LKLLEVTWGMCIIATVAPLMTSPIKSFLLYAWSHEKIGKAPRKQDFSDFEEHLGIDDESKTGNTRK